MRIIRLTITVDVVTTDDESSIKDLLIADRTILEVDAAIHNQCVNHVHLAKLGDAKGELTVVSQESK